MLVLWYSYRVYVLHSQPHGFFFMLCTSLPQCLWTLYYQCPSGSADLVCASCIECRMACLSILPFRGSLGFQGSQKCGHQVLQFLHQLYLHFCYCGGGPKVSHSFPFFFFFFYPLGKEFLSTSNQVIKNHQDKPQIKFHFTSLINVKIQMILFKYLQFLSGLR